MELVLVDVDGTQVAVAALMEVGCTGKTLVRSDASCLRLPLLLHAQLHWAHCVSSLLRVGLSEHQTHTRHEAFDSVPLLIPPTRAVGHW